MKIGIITFHASHNYGSNLQAWALQTYLERLGNEVEIINYRSFYQKSCYFRLFDFSGKYWYRFALPVTLKRLLLYPSSIKQMINKWYLFEKFIQNNLHLSPEYNTIKQLMDAKFGYDIAIAGSDQIWITTKEAGNMFFLNFMDKNIKKISYAPSMGPNPEKISVDYLKQNLIDFEAISVREKKAQIFLLDNHITDKCEVVCDPTLLLTENDYLQLIDAKPLISEPYIFFYSPSCISYKHFEIANKLGETLGLKVISSEGYYPKDIHKYKSIQNYIEVGPKEFLNLVKNATYTIGASFHLLVFSVLFRKQFYSINGDKDSRLANLLEILKLQRRAVSLDDANFDMQPIINFDQVYGRLSKYRQSSINFLSNVINKI